MAIAGYAVGANHGYVYVRAEYPLAVKRLTTAIRQAEHAGLLGRGSPTPASASTSRSALVRAPSSAARRRH